MNRKFLVILGSISFFVRLVVMGLFVTYPILGVGRYVPRAWNDPDNIRLYVFAIACLLFTANCYLRVRIARDDKDGQ